MMGVTRAVIFDAFGTLVTATPSAAHRRIAALVPTRAEELRLAALTTGMPPRELAARFGVPEIGGEVEEMLAAEVPLVRLQADAGDAIPLLGSDGIPYAVCSNLANGYCERVRELTPGAKAHIFSCELGKAKPDPAIYEAARSALGLEPGEILFVGDTRSADFDGPRSFGMQAALVDRARGNGLVEIVALRAGPPRPVGPRLLHRY
jgi:putative hydrolase of the HAD superfamily